MAKVRAVRILLILTGLLVLSPASTKSQPLPDRVQTASPSENDDGDTLKPAEPDFRLINLPTTLRLPLYRSNFQMTHRFNGNFHRGSFGEQASNLFGIDEGAVIGLEFRFAIARHVQAAFYRTSFDKTVQLHGKYDALSQGRSSPVAVSALLSVEGGNNFKERRIPALGAIVSRSVADTFAVYASPVWVHHSAAAAGFEADTAFIGIGGRVRVRPTVYAVAEVSPRISGYRPGSAEFAFGIEKRAGGHMFQLNVGNSQISTFGQLARGGFPQSLYLGFNLARKFY